MVSPRPVFSPASSLCFLLLSFHIGAFFAEGRTPRILTGVFPAQEITSENSSGIVSEGSENSEYLLPPPENPLESLSKFTPEDAQQFIPLNIPSIENHRLQTNWSKETTPNFNEVQITSVIKQVAVPPQGSKIRRKVNVDKFRECIFFRVCKKAECFHYGRFGACKTKTLN